MNEEMYSVHQTHPITISLQSTTTFTFFGDQFTFNFLQKKNTLAFVALFNQIKMVCIIEELTETVRLFAISQNEQCFEDQLDVLVLKMKKMNSGDYEERWDTLRENYSKLKYLYEIINFYHIESSKFMESLGVFMESIDRTTQFYLKEINWFETEPELLQDSVDIHNCLSESLNTNDPVAKLNTLLQAYKILVGVIEDIRNEKCEPVELDPSFLETFPTPKRIKK
jgi:hypothetical protein